MRTLTCSVGTGGRKIKSLHPDNACDSDTWEARGQLQIDFFGAAPGYSKLTRRRGQTQSSRQFFVSAVSLICKSDTSAALR